MLKTKPLKTMKTIILKTDGTGDAINPTSHSASDATFSGLSVATGHSLVVYRDGSVWFTVTARSAGGNDD